MKTLLIKLISFYQRNISPYHAACCRFKPTCSAYALQAIHKYGALKGSFLALKRILRCNPFYKGDFYDPVP